MIIEGKYNSAKVFTDNIDETTKQQIKSLCNQKQYVDSKIRIAPDCHAGAGCVIGTTMTINDKITPNLLGVDIGCGVTAIKFDNVDIVPEMLDEVIREHIPSGFNVGRGSRQKLLEKYDIHLDKLRCEYDPKVNIIKGYKAVGSLGGGNHFIELNKSNLDGNLILAVHSGSRGIGLQVATHYQKCAEKYCKELYDSKYKEGVNLIIEEADDNTMIGESINIYKESFYRPSKDLSYLDNQLMEDYLHDVDIMQKYASMNRNVILADIVYNYINKEEKFYDVLDTVINAMSRIESVHNYISIDEMILRKGAISAHKDETLIIPINMRDGSIIGRGKGSIDWNCSAPHGAGRILSRKQAKQKIQLDTVKEQMKGIYTTSLNNKTLDEAPDSYKPIDDILDNIGDSVEIIDIVKPIYNFKAD